MIAARDELSRMHVGRMLSVNCPGSEIIGGLREAVGRVVDGEASLEKGKKERVVRKIKGVMKKTVASVLDTRIVKSTVPAVTQPLTHTHKHDTAPKYDSAVKLLPPGITRTPNFISMYKSKYTPSEQPRLRSTNVDVFNYSMQEARSTGYQLRALREGMEKDVFLTYGTVYLGDTVGRDGEGE
jgi:hypothetical protein